MGNDESGVRTHAVLQPIGLKSIALDHSAIPPYLHTLIYIVMFKLFFYSCFITVVLLLKPIIPNATIGKTTSGGNK